jgi:hypothetical protein
MGISPRRNRSYMKCRTPHRVRRARRQNVSSLPKVGSAKCSWQELVCMVFIVIA